MKSTQEMAQAVCGWLEKKRELFLQYEQATYAITAGTQEEIGGHMEKREELQKQIQETDAQILAVTGGDQPDEGQQLLRRAAGGQAGYEELAPELQPVQTAAAEIRAVMYRIREMEPLVLERLETERKDLLQKIKNVNQGSGAAASKYYQSSMNRKPPARPGFAKI